MRGVDYIKMQREELQAEKEDKKAILSAIVEIMEYVLKAIPDFEVDQKKTAAECYDKMREKARKEQKGGSYCFAPMSAIQFVREYLGASAIDNAVEPQKFAQEPHRIDGNRKRRRLEDFF